MVNIYWCYENCDECISFSIDVGVCSRCKDGFWLDNNFCQDACVVELNGIVEPNEECDDNNRI